MVDRINPNLAAKAKLRGPVQNMVLPSKPKTPSQYPKRSYPMTPDTASDMKNDSITIAINGLGSRQPVKRGYPMTSESAKGLKNANVSDALKQAMIRRMKSEQKRSWSDKNGN